MSFLLKVARISILAVGTSLYLVTPTYAQPTRSAPDPAKALVTCAPTDEPAAPRSGNPKMKVLRDACRKTGKGQGLKGLDTTSRS